MLVNSSDLAVWLTLLVAEHTEQHGGLCLTSGQTLALANQERIGEARQRGTLPYWIKDNPKYAGGNPKSIKGEMVNSQKQVPVGSAAMPSGLGSYEQKLWNNNEIEISEKLEITQGWPMTHEQADDRHANPNYVAGERNGYDINCQSCVVAYEMRRRGFDVEALRRIENDPYNGPQRLAIDTCSAWIDPKTGKQPSKTNCRGTYFDKKDGMLKVFSIDDVIEKLNAETKEIGRYHLDWTWNFQQNGHTIVAERFKNGGLRLFDPQTGEITSWDNFKNRIYIRNGVNVLKVDELMPNPSVVATVVKTKI
jgi:hypothetical protein